MLVSLLLYHGLGCYILAVQNRVSAVLRLRRSHALQGLRVRQEGVRSDQMRRMGPRSGMKCIKQILTRVPLEHVALHALPDLSRFLPPRHDFIREVVFFLLVPHSLGDLKNAVLIKLNLRL